jgi:hypothetical protein
VIANFFKVPGLMIYGCFGGFNVSCPWREVAVSPVSFSLLFPVPSVSVVGFEYFFVYVSLRLA